MERSTGMEIPTAGLADYILGLARDHGVIYCATPNDALAMVFTHLADDEMEMDEIELLLLALERAGVLPSEMIVPLHINYLRETLTQTSDAGARP